jgi:hypothetical protein
LRSAAQPLRSAAQAAGSSSERNKAVRQLSPLGHAKNL